MSGRFAVVAAQTGRQLARRSVVQRKSCVTRGAGGGHPPPPIVQQATPSQPLHEHADLLWDDGVAPEMTLDFDAPNYSATKGLMMWLGGIGFFVTFYNWVKYIQDPPSKAKAVPKAYDEAIIRPALGGHPNPQ